MRVTSVQTSTCFFQNANHPCVQSCGPDEMSAQRFSNPQKASSYFVCRRVFEKGNEKGMCIRMCDVSPFLWLFVFDFFRTEREMLYTIIGHQTAAQTLRDMSSLTTSSWRSWIREWWTERKGPSQSGKGVLFVSDRIWVAVHHFSDTISTPENSPKVPQLVMISPKNVLTLYRSLILYHHRCIHTSFFNNPNSSVPDAESRPCLEALQLGPVLGNLRISQPREVFFVHAAQNQGFLGLQPLNMGNGWVTPL